MIAWIIGNSKKIPRKGIYGTKPLNPVLGELFQCTYDHGDSVTEFIAEQGKGKITNDLVSHHPPISGVYIHNEKLGFVCSGHSDPKAGFYGNYMSISNEGMFYTI